ncbi:MAG: hypothetical protein HN736_00425 [Anaerolineae bacterium]|mgnify:CR=1 FL=1|jgi:hypothetical protein|nr:hypothetical protein [Anaerolineae bacterium]MBT7483425.1 hypothetical protein [Candidatus Peregrinibacteria bacterium]MBT3712747.1 hypothetical protein [Anaerolineae bacterium]MBT4312433.1 hypothetical protein [Anaerolineae bacterium]MBT4458169.1 hypothetical protein [Anaerolineae bacterium]
MPRIRCLYFNCLYLDDDICTAPSVEIDPDIGCTTYAQTEDDLVEKDGSYEDWDIEDIEIDMDDNEDGESWD